MMFRSLLLVPHLTLLVVGWELSLLHINDIHARMEETNKYSAPCQEKDRKKGCYGGVARIFSAVKKLREDESNVLWLNAGDFYQGTLWYTKFKWQPVVEFNNMLNFDAMTLGNHELDDGMEGLLPFLEKTTCPIVVANMDVSNVPGVPENIYKPSIILDKGGKKIGIVGYLTPDTIFTASPPPELELDDEVDAVRREVEKMQKQGVDIIIALGHSGYWKDKEIAEKVPGVDIVVGGHTHSFLFTETESKKNPSNNRIIGDYPTVVTNVEGNKVLVVQAFAFSKYLGHIKVNFTDEGVVNNWQGMPILLDNTHPKDPEVVAALNPWQVQLVDFKNKVVGDIKVNLNRSGYHQGRSEETNIGNFITDAMVWAYRDKTSSEGKHFRLAVLNSGGIRSGITAGQVTIGQLLSVLPFESTMDSLLLEGRYIREVLERSVSDFDPATGHNDAGQFLQVSGFKIIYDLSKETGERAVDIQVMCDDCTEATFLPLEDNKTYGIITSSYLAKGGDGMEAFKKHKREHSIGLLDSEVVQGFLLSGKMVGGKEGRIVFGSGEESRTSSTNKVTSSLLATFFCYIFSVEECETV